MLWLYWNQSKIHLHPSLMVHYRLTVKTMKFNCTSIYWDVTFIVRHSITFSLTKLCYFPLSVTLNKSLDKFLDDRYIYMHTGALPRSPSRTLSARRSDFSRCTWTTTTTPGTGYSSWAPWTGCFRWTPGTVCSRRTLRTCWGKKLY